MTGSLARSELREFRRMTAVKFLVVLAVWLLGGACVAGGQSERAGRFSVVEASITDMQAAMTAGEVTSRQIVEAFLQRIAYYDTLLHATLAVNRHALDEADALDRERAAGRVRGPLHGIPVALKDNIHTTNLPTTGGALAFSGFTPRYEATLATRLREAGAIVIAKTGMTELANWIAGAPTPMPANYNAISGFGFNPYDPRRHPHPGSDGRPVLSTGGSSSGLGTAASLWAANVGTETSGSILSPANQTMLAAVKPTVGRVSRYGVMPITADQDTPGPMAKYVTDVAILLGALEGTAPDPNDAATDRCAPPPGNDYRAFLRPDGLRGARIGIPRAYFYEPVPGAGGGAAVAGGGLSGSRSVVMTEVIAILKQAGATIVDPANIPSVVEERPEDNFLRWEICSGATAGRGHDVDCSIVLKYGMKRDFNAWLESLGTEAPVKTLGELRQWNLEHEQAGSLKYGQSNLDISDEVDVERDRARYLADRAKDLRLTATTGLDAVMEAERLDAVLFPGSAGAGIAARPGYPTVVVPFGMVPNEDAVPVPEGFTLMPQPYGVSFTGSACSEPRLLELAYAFEQATRRRVQPPSTP